MKFPTLKTFRVVDCQSQKSLPLVVKNLPELETLVVGFCFNLDLELCKDHHEKQSDKLKLKHVHLSALPQLVSLPQWLQVTINSLQSLHISFCHNLVILPEWLSNLTHHLKVLFILNCPKLLSLPDNLTALESLTIKDCPELCRKYQRNVGELWSNISHIKEAIIGDQRGLDIRDGKERNDRDYNGMYDKHISFIVN